MAEHLLNGVVLRAVKPTDKDQLTSDSEVTGQITLRRFAEFLKLLLGLLRNMINLARGTVIHCVTSVLNQQPLRLLNPLQPSTNR